MAQKLAGLNTHGLCDWLTKKGITDFVSHIQAWNYDGQQLVALTEEQIVGLEICEASRKKLLKAIYPNSKAMSDKSGLLSRFRKKSDGPAGHSAPGSFDGTNDENYDQEWDDDEFDDDFHDEEPSTHQEPYQQQQDQQQQHHQQYQQQHSANSGYDDEPLPPPPPSFPAHTPPIPGHGALSAKSSNPRSVLPRASTSPTGLVPVSTPTTPLMNRGDLRQAAPVSSSVRPGRATSQIQAPTNSEDISTQNYYNPSMDRRQAEYILQQAQVDGAFVVRNSSKVPGEYSMSLFYQGHVRHLRIRRRNDNMFALGEQKMGEKFFISVVEMVAYHKCEPINLQSGGFTVLTYGYR
ncbi:B-cell linker protein-like [Sycon ciliatum]|uniref:B-cell linker protein-like n=1 Tax=Sycon ciliatum TaxID=27933 RepID=UPI0031F672EE